MTLHPQAQAFVEAIAQSPAKPWWEMTPDEGREIYLSFREFVGDAAEVDFVNDASIGGVKCRVYDPRTEDRRPVAFFHGGGWVLGCIETHDTLCRNLAAESGRPIVSVDYRRAPETPFPGALEDCFSVCESIQKGEAAAAFASAIDQETLTVAGDSAGGNLAAAVAIKARDSQTIKIDQQILIYPVIDTRVDTDSYLQFADGYGLTRQAMEWFWEQYLAGQAPTPLAAPARCSSLERLPPALVLTAEYDVLRDEGEVYARRLSDSAVAVELIRYPGMLHGFVHLAGVFDDGRDAVKTIGKRLKAYHAL